ncbi:MAG: hypothetical protein A2Z32_10230 [Chloroflexi bacterium RBG_16_69_14]|nr:MAG: hypothetical protein A2Z32_10230 [Chloroflexi bacterium RBG_16_69_14]
MTDGPQPPDFDPELWITADGYDGRLYLLGNAHTHLGRIVVWSEAIKAATNVSKYEVTDASAASRRWIEGFLRGNEPGPAEYLGIDELAEADLDSDDPAYARWRAGLAEYYRTGTTPPLAPVPTVPFSEDATFSHVPWIWAGGQVWIWKDCAWVVADPQPALDGGLLAGTVCATRGYHEMDGSDERHEWCVECGETAELFR